VLDLRSIRPIDIDLIVDSVKKTNRVVVAEEGWKYYGTGQAWLALIYEHAFDYLDAPFSTSRERMCRCPIRSPWSELRSHENGYYQRGTGHCARRAHFVAR